MNLAFPEKNLHALYDPKILDVFQLIHQAENEIYSIADDMVSYFFTIFTMTHFQTDYFELIIYEVIKIRSDTENYESFNAIIKGLL